MKFTSLDDFIKDVLQDADSRAAYEEHRYAIRLAELLEAERQRRGWSLRRLAEEMSTSLSQVQRVLAEHASGTVTLRTVFRALEALDLDLAPPQVVHRGIQTWSGIEWCGEPVHINYALGSVATPKYAREWTGGRDRDAVSQETNRRAA